MQLAWAVTYMLPARTPPSCALESNTGPLWGVPAAIKDNVDVAGVRTTAACPAFSYTPAESAPAVKALTDAGACVFVTVQLT